MHSWGEAKLLLFFFASPVVVQTTCSYYLEDMIRIMSSAVSFDPSRDPNYTYDSAAPLSATEQQPDGSEKEGTDTMLTSYNISIY